MNQEMSPLRSCLRELKNIIKLVKLQNKNRADNSLGFSLLHKNSYNVNSIN